MREDEDGFTEKRDYVNEMFRCVQGLKVDRTEDEGGRCMMKKCVSVRMKEVEFGKAK